MSEYSGNIRDLPVVTGGHFIENSTKKIVFGPDGRFWNDYVMRLFTLEPEAESSVHSHPWPHWFLCIQGGGLFPHRQGTGAPGVRHLGPCARRRAPQLRQYRQGAADGPVHRAAGGGCESPERVLNRLPDPAKKRPDRNLSGLFYRVRLEIMPKSFMYSGICRYSRCAGSCGNRCARSGPFPGSLPNHSASKPHAFSKPSRVAPAMRPGISALPTRMAFSPAAR